MFKNRTQKAAFVILATTLCHTAWADNILNDDSWIQIDEAYSTNILVSPKHIKHLKDKHLDVWTKNVVENNQVIQLQELQLQEIDCKSRDSRLKYLAVYNTNSELIGNTKYSLSEYPFSHFEPGSIGGDVVNYACSQYGW